MPTTDTDPIQTTTRSDLVVDGRTARRNRNKMAVLDALIELAREGDDEPAIESIAELAGVSYRSVYRYFDDRTDLMLSAIGRLMEDVWPLLDVDESGPIDERITRLVTARIAVYRKLAPLARIAVHRRMHEPIVAERYERIRDTFRQRLTSLFDAELSAVPSADRPLVIAGLDVMFQFEALDYLARTGALTDDDLARVLIRHVWCLLGPDAPPMPTI